MSMFCNEITDNKLYKKHQMEVLENDNKFRL